MSDDPIIANDTPFAQRKFQVETAGILNGGNALFNFCEDPAKLRDLIPGQSRRLSFKSGAGRSSHTVERIA